MADVLFRLIILLHPYNLFVTVTLFVSILFGQIILRSCLSLSWTIKGCKLFLSWASFECLGFGVELDDIATNIQSIKLVVLAHQSMLVWQLCRIIQWHGQLTLVHGYEVF